ncbi:MAG TPA: TIM barrel protein [Acidimicrobiales bacterium]|nr:TIM barrel protein [Acidimicrobiales bacterium]
MKGDGGRMEFGICSGPPGRDRANMLRAAGCDYYEPMVAGAIMAKGSSDFDTSVDEWHAGGLEPKSANVLLPGRLKIVGPDADPEELRAYLTEAMRRAQLLGTETVVFGSGTARAVPDGFPRDDAYAQLKQAVRLACGLAGPGTLVCLEHLRRAETNIVNRLAEAGAIVEELGLANLALVVDGYHLAEENEDVSVVRQVAGNVAHVHVCGPARRPPGESDVDRMAALFEQLVCIGYEGRCSIECNFSDVEAEAPAALAAVRRAAGVAGLA